MAAITGPIDVMKPKPCADGTVTAWGLQSRKKKCDDIDPGGRPADSLAFRRVIVLLICGVVHAVKRGRKA